MLQFIESTWLLWWIFALVMIFRWFHVLSAGSESEDLDQTSEAGSNPASASGGQFLLGA